MTFLENYDSIFLMPRPLKQGKLDASTITIDKYAFLCSSNFNETDVTMLIT